MRFRTAVAALAGLMLATAVAAGAQIAPGTLLDGTIDGDYSSNHAYAGQSVTVSNVRSDSGSAVRNGRLYGYVYSVQKAGQGTPGKIRFRFTELVNGNGVRYTIDSRVTNVNVQTKNNAAKEAVGALAGMLVGNAIGKTLFGASGGGIVGAAGGFLLAKNNRENVNVPSGSYIQVELLSVTRRQSH
ncbi:MAG TPA: hypothetical protein VMG98_08895 [Verrucomicrobiae bacterium]|nr:hypothetical protein [Verrucomicrobiae bacterium]